MATSYRAKVVDEGQSIIQETITPKIAWFLEGGVTAEVWDYTENYESDEDGIQQARLILRPFADLRNKYKIKTSEMYAGQLIDWRCPMSSIIVMSSTPGAEKILITCDFVTKQEFFLDKHTYALRNKLAISEHRRAQLEESNAILKREMKRVIERYINAAEIADLVVDKLKDFLMGWIKEKRND